MKKGFILAIDQGSTTTKVILVNQNGFLVAENEINFQSDYPAPGCVEFNALEVWNTVLRGINNVMNTSKIKPEDIKGVGITNQRESIIIWDKNTGKPLFPAISWQCRRSVNECKKMVEDGHSDLIRKKTGLFIDSYYSASKIKWLFDYAPKIKEKVKSGGALIGNVDSWLIWNLTKGKVHATDVSNASRTLLMNIRDTIWDEDLLKLWSIPRRALPQIKMSSDFYGFVDNSILEGEVPILGCIGDAQSNVFGQCAFKKYSAVNIYGTASNLDVNIGQNFFLSKNKIQTTIGWGIYDKVTYLLEGGVFTSGAVINWLKDGLKLVKDGTEATLIASKTKSNGGVYFVPAFVGLSAPYWDPYARGTIIGLSYNAGREEIIRAAMESIVYQVNDILISAEKDIGEKVKYLKVSGGVSRSNFVVQFQADISNVKVIRSSVVNSTALGTAFLAGLKAGLWMGIEELLTLIPKSGKEFMPIMSEKQRNKNVQEWRRAIKRSLEWIK